jgi:hypothetical protein
MLESRTPQSGEHTDTLRYARGSLLTDRGFIWLPGALLSGYSTGDGYCYDVPKPLTASMTSWRLEKRKFFSKKT